MILNNFQKLKILVLHSRFFVTLYKTCSFEKKWMKKKIKEMRVIHA